ncbi:MAG TPA: DUF5682 family protein [Acidimicrobiales bacterium]
MTASGVRVLGIRHHGPGSARAVAAALDELKPELVLVEGPPELDGVVGLAGSPAMRPPVAALVYAVDAPRRAGFYPMAAFSPEWIALRWAVGRGRPVRFLDLPAAASLARHEEREDEDRPENPRVRDDPLGALATAAGYDDTERWWEDAIEHRYHGLDVFAAVLDAMAALREADHADKGHADEHNERREAAMRRVLRAAMKEGHDRIAVVCGAWHAPALMPETFPTQTADAFRLKGLPTVKVAATWVPWTSSRLARASGYGAGVTAPGWYSHLFTAPDEVVLRWLVRVAGLLREERLDVSSASVIEAVRLSETLATMRGRPLAGLDELMESTQAVLCGGSSVPVQLVARRLLVGDDLGRVPPETPMVPLARDLAAAQKRLRLKPSASAHELLLDLRTDSHLERSKLFHRLLLLDVPWAQPTATGATRGTFKEAWVLEWHPELEVALIEASGSGTTIEAAATAVVTKRAAEGAGHGVQATQAGHGVQATQADIAELSRLVEAVLLADLPDALAAVLAVLAERAALQQDTAVLMAAVEPLARVRRYGSVRRFDTDLVHQVLDGIVTRVTVGLPSACVALDDEAAAEVRRRIDSVQRGIGLLDDPELRARWLKALAQVAARDAVHGAVAGRAVRLLLDAAQMAIDDVSRRLSLVLSPAEDASRGAAWLEGFLSGDAVLLLHEPELLGVIDGWVTAVAGTTFDDLLPLLRRTFAPFPAAERRAIGERIRRLAAGQSLGRDGSAFDDDEPLDRERAARVLPRLLELLGGRP